MKLGLIGAGGHTKAEDIDLAAAVRRALVSFWNACEDAEAAGLRVRVGNRDNGAWYDYRNLVSDVSRRL